MRDAATSLLLSNENVFLCGSELPVARLSDSSSLLLAGLRRELEVGVRRESTAELSVAAASQQPFSITIAVVTAAASGSS